MKHNYGYCPHNSSYCPSSVLILTIQTNILFLLLTEMLCWNRRNKFLLEYTIDLMMKRKSNLEYPNQQCFYCDLLAKSSVRKISSLMVLPLFLFGRMSLFPPALFFSITPTFSRCQNPYIHNSDVTAPDQWSFCLCSLDDSGGILSYLLSSYGCTLNEDASH